MTALPTSTPPSRQFAKYYQALTLNTLAQTVSDVDWDFGQDWVCDWIEIAFPPGCANLVQITVSLTGVSIVPWLPGAATGDGFIVGDNKRTRYDMRVLISQPLNIAYENDDTFPHLIAFEAQLQQVNPDTPASVTPAGPTLVVL